MNEIKESERRAQFFKIEKFDFLSAVSLHLKFMLLVLKVGLHGSICSRIM